MTNIKKNDEVLNTIVDQIVEIRGIQKSFGLIESVNILLLPKNFSKIIPRFRIITLIELI